MDLRALLSRLEYLGVDCQAVRDLIEKSRTDSSIVTYFQPLLSTLETIIAGNTFTPNSSPLPIEMLLRQLKKGLTEYKPMINPVVNPVSGASPELLEVLLDLKKDISDLKKNSGQVTVIQAEPSQPAHNSIGMSPVFINPLDDKELKGNVSIEEKSGSNISNKLERLKQLKRDK